jgi:anthranilate synthase component I
MNISPSFTEFAALAKRFNVIPLTCVTMADRVTPVSVYERLRQGEPYSFLLESVEGGERFGRYSFVGQRPYAVFTCRGAGVRYVENGKERRWESKDPVEDLKRLFQRWKPAPIPALPRFWGGAVGYWDYETVRFFEKFSKDLPDSLGAPTGAFQLTRELVIFDRLAQTASVISSVFIPDGSSSKALRELYKQGVRSVKRQLRRLHDRSSLKSERPAGAPGAPKALTTPDAYKAGVKKAQEYIRAGEIIQVVLSQRWMLKPKATPFQVYRALRMVNPSPYMYLLHFPDVELVGSSPELLVRKENNLAETRPIAGTRRRGANEEEDRALAKELLEDPKERAEHLMLVDLGRNDLGRVCEPGSVRVPSLMTVENFSHVMHIVSSVVGKLRSGANAFDLLRACFPAGTVSGAPKIRAMQIISELESFRRGPYAGAVGYFSYTGNMDMAITIRTLFFVGGNAYLQAGAGIVADSVPESELRECEQKAEALFEAVKRTRELL